MIESRTEGRAACALFMVLAACTVAPPASAPGGGSGGAGKKPGAPFEENVCFQCSLRHCSVAANACTQNATCAPWLECVSACPTDDTGAAAEEDCVRDCGLPVSAEVLYTCIQQFANGFFLGCEAACEPL